MVTYLLENGQIKTTVTRAKEVAPVAEKMITLAKKNDLASYRQALGFITKEDVAKKLFQELGPKYAERNGGYTRIVRIAPAAATPLRWLSSSWCNSRRIVWSSHLHNRIKKSRPERAGIFLVWS